MKEIYEKPIAMVEKVQSEMIIALSSLTFGGYGGDGDDGQARQYNNDVIWDDWSEDTATETCDW